MELLSVDNGSANYPQRTVPHFSCLNLNREFMMGGANASEEREPGAHSVIQTGSLLSLPLLTILWATPGSTESLYM